MLDLIVFGGKSLISDKPRFLCGRIRGYHFVSLTNKDGLREFQVHRLVLETFVEPCPDGYQTNHKDGNKQNNRLENLEWMTCGENHAHAFKIGLRSNKGEHHSQARLKNGEVWLIKKLLWHKQLQKDVAKMFKVTVSMICLIGRGERWSHIEFIPTEKDREVLSRAAYRKLLFNL